MKVEQAKQIASKAIELLSDALERGHSETLRNYLAAMARFHRYSLHNLILIVSQRPDATRVAGFHTWKQLGRNVKKGARGIMILAPVVLRRSKEEPTSDEDHSEAAVRFRVQGKVETIHCRTRYSTRILSHHLSRAGAMLAWKDRSPAGPVRGGGVRHVGPRSGAQPFTHAGASRPNNEARPRDRGGSCCIRRL